MKRSLLTLIRGYIKWVSPFLPTCCRYYPTCSAYAYQAICVFGWRKGGWLALKRILSCHPWSVGGYSPLVVPHIDDKNSAANHNIHHTHK